MMEIFQDYTTTAIAASSAIAVAAVGGVTTEIGAWYENLRKPWWKPPNWAFGPIWTVVLTLAAISGIIAWRAAATPGEQNLVIWLFAINGVLNALWSPLFFKLRRPDWALIEAVFLWLSVLALIVFLWPLAPAASLCLAPYILWVSIANVLNWTIVRMNKPFGARVPAAAPQ
jgi:translocator protein